MVPASTKQGYAVSTFPDVCHTPGQPSPVPMPYPSVGVQSQVKGLQGRDVSRTVVKTISDVGMSTGDIAAKGVMSQKVQGKAQYMTYSFDVTHEGAPTTRLGLPGFNNSPKAGQLRARLQAITAQLTTLQGGNPDLWHQLADEYVVVAAELYLELTSG